MAAKKKGTATAAPKPIKQDVPDEPWAVAVPVQPVAPKPPKPPRPTSMIDPNKIDPIPAAKRTVNTTRRRPSVRADIPSRGYNYTESDTASGRPAYVRRQEIDQAQMTAQAIRRSKSNAPLREPTIPVGAPRRNEYAPPGLLKSDKITGTSSAKVRQRGGIGAPLSVRPPKKKK